MDILGIDVGGSGIKGALVDCGTGELLTERHRIPTPDPSRPEAVARALQELVDHFSYSGPIGCGFPAAIVGGKVMTASNISKKWLGVEGETFLSEKLKNPVFLLNDADAAGIAEMEFGAGEGSTGLVFLVTVGTGLGTVLFTDGVLVPNTELGHVFFRNGKEAEEYASDAARKEHDLSWEKWGKRFNKYLSLIESLFWPDLIVVGGGASKKFDNFSNEIEVETPVVPATLQNQAGIVGAALYALQRR